MLFSCSEVSFSWSVECFSSIVFNVSMKLEVRNWLRFKTRVLGAFKAGHEQFFSLLCDVEMWNS